MPARSLCSCGADGCQMLVGGPRASLGVPKLPRLAPRLPDGDAALLEGVPGRTGVEARPCTPAVRPVEEAQRLPDARVGVLGRPAVLKRSGGLAFGNIAIA